LHSPEQELSEQGLIKKILRLIGKLVRIAFILILLIIVIGLGSSVIKEKKTNTTNIISKSAVSSNLSVTNQDNIINYLNSVGSIEKDITKNLNLRNEDINSFNNKRMTAKEYINNLTVYKNRILDSIQHIEKISCPDELSAYSKELKNNYSILSLALKLEIDYIQTGNKNTLNECEKQFNIFNESNMKKGVLINNILDKYNIQHN
jgi:hypothetical protein